MSTGNQIYGLQAIMLWTDTRSFLLPNETTILDN